MELAEIEQAALLLPDVQRASLVATLLETLPPGAFEISDEEVERREVELSRGKVSAMSHEEFIKRVRQSRSR